MQTSFSSHQCRFRALGLALAGAVVAGLGAQEENAFSIGPEAAPLPAELAALLDDLQPGAWQRLGTVSAAWGQRENPGLSTVAPESAGFGQLGLEGFLRRETERLEVLALLDGRGRWYDGHAVVDDETSWFGRAEGRLRLRRWLEVNAAAQGYWQDQVLDLSETIGARTVAPVRVAGGDLGAGLRLRLPAGLTLAGLGRTLRADYQGVAEDHVARERRGELSWAPWSWLELGGAVVAGDRDYDFRGEATSGGRVLDDTRLALAQAGRELWVKLGWTRWGRWRLEGRWSTLENRDGASGFYDYDRDRWSVETEWSFGAWTVRGRHESGDLLYRRQTVGAGLTPAARRQRDTWWEAEVRRSVGETWELFGHLQRDESRSNDDNASYADRTVWVGVAYLF